MKTLDVSDFLKNEQSPFVLGAFFSRYLFSEDNKYIYTYGWYKKSNVIETEISYENSFNDYVQIINEESMPNPNWTFLNDVSPDIPISNKLRRFKSHFYILKNEAS